MDLASLRLLVAGGENERVEFKRKVSNGEKVARELVAFANSGGGTLVVGVEDNLTIPGLKDPDGDEYVLDRAIERACRPALPVQRYRLGIGGEAAVLIYEVAEGDDKPYAVEEEGEPRCYVRVQDRSVQASKELRQVLRQSKRERQYQFEFGDKEKALMTHLALHRHITLPQFATLAGVPVAKASRTLVLLVLAGLLDILPGEGLDRYQLKPTPEA